jgi:hypothetical protein
MGWERRGVGLIVYSNSQTSRKRGRSDFLEFFDTTQFQNAVYFNGKWPNAAT